MANKIPKRVGEKIPNGLFVLNNLKIKKTGNARIITRTTGIGKAKNIYRMMQQVILRQASCPEFSVCLALFAP
jgi:hypothetical protein